MAADAADLVIDTELDPEHAVSRIRRGLLHPATLGLGRDGCAGFCLGRHFVVWRLAHTVGTPEERLLPRPALVGRIDPIDAIDAIERIDPIDRVDAIDPIERTPPSGEDPAGSRISARFRAPAPDIVLVAPLFLFSCVVLGVFGLAGIAGIIVVVIGWGIPARIIAARFLERDAPPLERWLRTSLASPGQASRGSRFVSNEASE